MKPLPILLRPPLIALALIVISVIFHFNFPILQIIYYPFNLLGIGGIIIGLYVALSGKKTFQKLETPLMPGEKPKKLVEEGLFKISRNPMYLGFIVALVGVAALFGSLIAFISPIVFFIVINFILIPLEEKLMEKTFGKKYLEYKKRVRRWI